MMTKDRRLKPFSKQELKVIGEKASVIPGRPSTAVFNSPISYRENAMNMFMDGRPAFMVTANDFSGLNPDFYKKHLGRGGRAEPNKIDAFGVKWTFEPTAGGSISVGGNPRFDGANNIDKLYEEYGDKIILQVTIPDFDQKDEKAAVAAARNYVDTYCKPGKPTILSARNCMSNKVFAEEVYEYSRKHFLSW